MIRPRLILWIVSWSHKILSDFLRFLSLQCISGIPLCHFRFPSHVCLRLQKERITENKFCCYSLISSVSLPSYGLLSASELASVAKWIVVIIVCHQKKAVSSHPICHHAVNVIAVFVYCRFPLTPASSVCLLFFCCIPGN